MVRSVPRIELGILGGKQVIGGFDAGGISSDGGVMLAQVEEQVGVIVPAGRRKRGAHDRFRVARQPSDLE